MSLSSDQALIIRSQRAYNPATFIWNNLAYACTAGTNSRSTEVGVGGIQASYVETIFVLQADLPKAPVEGDIVGYLGVDMKIVAVRTDAQNGGFYRLELQSPDI